MMFIKDIRARREEGLSLVELMVVVGILGLLAGIAFPIYFNAQREGIKSALRTDISNTAIAVGTYTAGAVEGEDVELTQEVFDAKKNQSPNNTITYEEYIRSNGKVEYCIQGQTALANDVIISYNLTTKTYIDEPCKASNK